MTGINTEEGSPRTARDLLEPMFRHKKKGMLFFLIVVMTTLAVLAFTPSEYTSTSKLIVRRGRENVFIDPTAASSGILPLHKSWESEMNSELEILGSRELMQEVVMALGSDVILANPEPKASGKLGLIRAALNPVHRLAQKFKKSHGNQSPGKSERKQDQAIRALEETLEIHNRETSDIIFVSYAANSPELAQEIVAQLVEIYLEKRIEVHRVAGSHQFFNQQAELLLAELQRIEESIFTIKSEKGISSLEDDRRSLQLTIESVRTQQLNIQSSLAAADARITLLSNMLPQPAGLDPNLKNRADVEEILALVTKPPPGNPHRNSETLPERRPEKVPPAATHNPGSTLLDPEAFKALQATLIEEISQRSALLAEDQEIGQQLTQLREERIKMNKLEAPIRRLERERELLEGKYHKYAENVEQARINHELETQRISNVSIVQHATLPGEANPSGKLFKLYAAMFLGLSGFIGVAFGANYLDPTLHSAADISERLDLTTLIELPRMQSNELVLTSSALGWRKYLGTLLMHSEKMPGRSADDCFQDLYLKILALRSSEKRGPLVIGITSTSAGEGVTMIATKLAAAFSNDGRFASTLLLDANPERHSEWMIKQMPQAPFAYQQIVDIENPDPPEAKPPTATTFIEYLSSARELDHDIIVVDIPSMNAGSYAVRIATELDLVVLVIDAGRIPWRTAQRTVQLLTNAQAQLAGTILNRKQVTMPKWLYQKL